MALTAVVGAMGALLPQEHMSSSSALYHRSVDSVWAVVTDIEHSASWRTDVQRIERLPDRLGRPVWSQIADGGGWPLVVMESVPKTRFRTDVADRSVGFGGSWVCLFTSESGGTRLSIVEAGYVENPYFRFWLRYVRGFHAGTDGYLRALGRKLGETVTPTHPS